MKKHKIMALVLGLALIFVSACTAGSENAQKEGENNEAKSAAPKEEEKADEKKETEQAPKQSIEKELTVGVPFFDSNMNPVTGYSGWYVMRMGLGETLIFVSESMEAKPWLCESYEATDENTWSFAIRENVKFHNGKSLTAEGVKESIELSRSKNDRAKHALEGVVFSVEGNKLIAKTETVDPVLPEKLSDPMFIIVDTEAAKDEDTFGKNPIGTGPYKMEAFVPGEQATAIPFKDYWEGEPRLSKIQVIKIPDANTRMMALQSGEINVSSGLGASQLAVLEKDDSFAIDTTPSMRIIYGMMNPKNTFLKDKNVRAALNFGLDKDTLAKTVLQGTVVAADGPYPPSLSFAKEKLGTFSYDVEKAKALLKESGFEDTDGDGIVEKEGKALTVRLTFYGSRAELPIIAQYMQAEYKKIGVNIELVPHEKMPVDIYKSGDFDIGFDSFTVALSSNPQTLLDIGFKTGASDNFDGYFKNDRVDEIAKQLAVEGKLENRNALAAEAEKLIVEEGMNLFIAYPQNSVVRRKNVKGFYIHPLDFYQIGVKTDIVE